MLCIVEYYAKIFVKGDNKMKTILRRYGAAFLALIMVLSLSVGLKLPAKAANVDYVYNGTYIYNWGNRGELATFLSPKAEDFYEKNNTSLDELLALDGSSTEKNVPSSTLYKKLQSIMKSNHSYVTSYDATRDKFQYTDCQNSGKTSNKISSFYSGKAIGPSWDSGKTWNREHVWPNSKGDASGNGENDIMMLRPTSVSENSSRGNKAYGEGSVSYYNPNSESGGNYDLRGDVSRVILYQYVRWSCTNTGSKYNPNGIFGTNGIIESIDILLKWMEEDPVDTWELGRNDSVQSITGTRNVFVDFPELAFDLFDEEVPAGYKTPSSSTTSSGYKITATANNSDWGRVSVSRNAVSAYAANGYEAVSYTIISGNGSVERIGDDFIVTTSGNLTIQINFAPIRTISFVEDNKDARKMTGAQSSSIKLPNHKTAIGTGYTFLGWTTSPLGDTEKKPSYSEPGDDYTISGNASLYALYSRKVNGKVVYFTNSPTGCTHPKAYKVARVEPTCQTAGTTEGMYCPDCKVYTSGHEKISNSGIAHKYNSKGICTVCSAVKPSTDNPTTSSKPSTDTSSKNNQTASKPDTSKPTTSKPTTSNKPSDDTSSKAPQNTSKPAVNDDVNSNLNEDEQLTSSSIAETETEDTVVTVDISESTIVVSDFLEEAINNNIPLILKAQNYTWSFERLMITADEARNFNAAIFKGSELNDEDVDKVRKATGGKRFYAFNFAHEGALPSDAIITLKVDNSFAGKNVELYTVTSSGKKILEGTATVSSDSVLRFETKHTSLMFITEAASSSSGMLWLWITIAILLAGGAAAIFVLYKKGIIFKKA